MAPGFLRIDLHPRHRSSWHVPTAARERLQRLRRQRWAAVASVALLAATYLLAGKAGLDRVAALGLTLGILLALTGRTPESGWRARVFPPVGLLLVLLGGAREVMLRRAPGTCQAAYDRADTGAARAGVLAREPYPALANWLIWMGRRSICADFIGVRREM